ncbi:MAG: hypothetical protein Q4P24_16590 [Rhodobacterales bacterium]|nr:hypothetical protein [Rhodobacterales bacterium]
MLSSTNPAVTPKAETGTATATIWPRWRVAPEETRRRRMGAQGGQGFLAG